MLAVGAFVLLNGFDKLKFLWRESVKHAVSSLLTFRLRKTESSVADETEPLAEKRLNFSLRLADSYAITENALSFLVTKA